MNLHPLWKVSIIATMVALPIIPMAVPFTFSSGQTINASQINANFASLEALISATGGVSPSNLVGVSVAVPSGGTQVLTVPASAARPYVLREYASTVYSVSLSRVVGAPSGCSLSAAAGATVVPLMVGSTAGISVPFAAGETVAISCDSSSNWHFVFSK